MLTPDDHRQSIHRRHMEKQYLIDDFKLSESWRLFKIMGEFVDGVDTLHSIGPAVSIFGSARIAADAPCYEKTEKIAALFAKNGFAVITGGGGGVMEAANKGAALAGGQSIGLNISLPHEQEPNPYISEELMFEFHYFFMRKFWLVYMAKALIIFPGGFGTLDEMTEVLTLLQTKKIHRPLPIIVFGQDYWKEIIDVEAMARWGTIAWQDLKFFTFVNSAEEAFHQLKGYLESLDLSPFQVPSLKG